MSRIDKAPEVYQGGMSLKKRFMVAALGLGIVAGGPLAAFHIEKAVVARNLAQSKREMLDNSASPLLKAKVDCIIEASVPLQARGIVYDRWAKRASLIESLSKHFGDKAVENVTVGTQNGLLCIVGDVSEVLKQSENNGPAPVPAPAQKP